METKKIVLSKKEAVEWIKEHGTGSLLEWSIEDPLKGIVDVEGAKEAGMLKDGEEVKVTITTEVKK